VTPDDELVTPDDESVPADLRLAWPEARAGSSLAPARPVLQPSAPRSAQVERNARQAHDSGSADGLAGLEARLVNRLDEIESRVTAQVAELSRAVAVIEEAASTANAKEAVARFNDETVRLLQTVRDSLREWVARYDEPGPGRHALNQPGSVSG
jgi:hypothetical protein